MKSFLTVTSVFLLAGCSNPFQDYARPNLWYYTGIDSTNATLLEEKVGTNESFIVLELTEYEMHRLRRNIDFISVDSFERIVSDSVLMFHEMFDLRKPDPKFIYYLHRHPTDVYAYYFLALDTSENKLIFGENFPEWF